VTINFTRMGVMSGVINSLFYPFFNARIQGTSKFYRTFAQQGYKKVGMVAGLKAMTWITMPSMVLWMVNRDEDWYRRLPLWQRLGFFNFQLWEDGPIFMIPKPFDLGYVFGALPEAYVNHFYQKNVDGWADRKEDWAKATKDTLEQFFPIDSWSGVLPQTIRPASESYYGYSSWRGQHIVPPWMEKSKLPEDQYTRYTSEVAKALSKLFHAGGPLKLSPARIDFLISGYTGGLGTKAIRGLENALALQGEFRDRPYEAADIPIVGTLITPKSRQISGPMGRLREEQNELRQKKGSGVASDSEVKRLSELNAGFKQILYTSILLDKNEITFAVSDQRMIRVLDAMESHSPIPRVSKRSDRKGTKEKPASMVPQFGTSRRTKKQRESSMVPQF